MKKTIEELKPKLRGEEPITHSYSMDILKKSTFFSYQLWITITLR